MNQLTEDPRFTPGRAKKGEQRLNPREQLSDAGIEHEPAGDAGIEQLKPTEFLSADIQELLPTYIAGTIGIMDRFKVKQALAAVREYRLDLKHLSNDKSLAAHLLTELQSPIATEPLPVQPEIRKEHEPMFKVGDVLKLTIGSNNTNWRIIDIQKGQYLLVPEADARNHRIDTTDLKQRAERFTFAEIDRLYN